MARVRQLDAQHATERVHKRTPRVGAQVTDHHIFRASSDEFQIAATERWEAALKIADRAASGHPCELDPAAGITECLHPDHEQDAEWAAAALDILGLPGDDLLPAEEPEPEWEPEQKKPRLSRSTFTSPNWNWQDHARCSGEDLVLFYGEDGEQRPEREVREAKAKRICRGCPVKTECLTEAFREAPQFGVWGGMTPDERVGERRRQMRRKKAA